MKEVMTSGEIARKAGVSQKALRIYDEKGLLRPVGYSEGNYKLYDKSSLMILEKIIALKHVGFSLEEIKSNLEELLLQLKLLPIYLQGFFQNLLKVD